MRKGFALSVLLLAATLAGCSSGQQGMGAASNADTDAQQWASDAVLLAGFGLELRGNVSSPISGPGGDDRMTAFFQAMQEAAVKDDTLGDGNAPAWAFGYYSPSKSTLFVTGSGFSGNYELPLNPHELNLSVDALRAARDHWTVDSHEAAALVLANTTAAYFFKNATSVQYSFDFFEGARWEISASGAKGSSLRAKVALDQPKMSYLQVSGVKLPKPYVPPPPRILPANLTDTQSVMASADPGNFLIGLPCAGGATGDWCKALPFTVTWDGQPAVHASGTLTWGTQGSQFDVYVSDSAGNRVLQGGSNALVPSTATSMSFAGDLPAGSYTVNVVANAAASETYTLAVNFR